MRILVVTSGQAWPGGIATHAALVTRELHVRGHEVAVASVGAPSPTDEMPWEAVRDAVAAARTAGEGGYAFRHEVVAPAAGYVLPMPSGMARVAARVVAWGAGVIRPTGGEGRAGMPADRPRQSSRIRGAGGLPPIWAVRAVGARLAAPVGDDAWASAERAFLTRLLLRTHPHDLARLDGIRARFDPDVEYVTDLALVPMVAKLPRRCAPMVAGAQGFELVVRRGVPLLPALRGSRHRIDAVVSGSSANVAANLAPWWDDLGGPLPVEVVPYGPADGAHWQVSRDEAIDLLRVAMPRAFGDLRSGEVPPRFVVAWLSRIDFEKGADLALHVLSVLRARGVDAEMWLAGVAMPGGAAARTVVAKAAVMDLEGCVRVVGLLPSLALKGAFLRAADAFLATFVRPEPFGLVVAEAMACGMPVVVPDSGGPGEVVRATGLDGLAYPANDTGAAASRLEELARDLAMRCRTGAMARAAFVERWNAVRTGAALEALFRRVTTAGYHGTREDRA